MNYLNSISLKRSLFYSKFSSHDYKVKDEKKFCSFAFYYISIYISIIDRLM